MEKITPFITSLWIDKLSSADHLFSNILEIQNLDITPRKKSNRGGWQSETFADGSHIFLNGLFDNIRDKVKTVYKELGIITDPTIKNYWFNCNKEGDFNLPHVHQYSFVSAVYYIKAPKNSGNIVFRRPDNFDLFIENAHIDTSDNYRIFFVTPEDNLLILFPSYLEHFVEPSQTNDLRMSLAINFG